MNCFNCHNIVSPKDVNGRGFIYRCKNCDAVFDFPIYSRKEENGEVTYTPNNPRIFVRNIIKNVAVFFSFFLPIIPFAMMGGRTIHFFIFILIYFVFLAVMLLLTQGSSFNKQKITIREGTIVFNPINKILKKILFRTIYIQNVHKIVISNEHEFVLNPASRYNTPAEQTIHYDSFKVRLYLLNGKKICLLRWCDHLENIFEFIDELEKDLGLGPLTSHEYRISEDDEYLF